MILIAQFNVRNEENTIIAIFPIELDSDLSIIINIVLVNSTTMYGNTNISVVNISLFFKFFIIFFWF